MSIARSSRDCLGSYLVDVLALELGEEGLGALLIGLDTDGGENAADVLGGGGLVTAEGKKKVSGEVLHFECVCLCRKECWLAKLAGKSKWRSALLVRFPIDGSNDALPATF